MLLLRLHTRFEASCPRNCHIRIKTFCLVVWFFWFRWVSVLETKLFCLLWRFIDRALWFITRFCVWTEVVSLFFCGILSVLCAVSWALCWSIGLRTLTAHPLLIFYLASSTCQKLMVSSGLLSCWPTGIVFSWVLENTDQTLPYTSFTLKTSELVVFCSLFIFAGLSCWVTWFYFWLPLLTFSRVPSYPSSHGLCHVKGFFPDVWWHSSMHQFFSWFSW